MSTTVVTRTANGTYTDSGSPAKSFYAAARTFAYVKGTTKFYFFRTALPADLNEREVISATLRVILPPPGGSRTTKLQRHADPSTGYATMNDNNKPGVLAGSTEHSITSTAQFRDFDVLADLVDVAGGGDYFGWRFSTSYTGGDVKVHGWDSEYEPTLTVVLGEPTSEPLNVRPHGLVSLSKWFVTWDGPDDIVSVQVQLDDEDGDFATPIFDSGTVTSTVPQLNLAATAYAGLADAATVDVRVRHTSTDNGVSEWSDPVTVTRKALTGLAITGPSSPSTDPTPTVTWTAAGQVAFQVTTSINGATVDETNEVPGADSAYTPAKGATAAGQVIRFRVRAWDDDDRTSSPGDPGYAEATLDVTYTPGTAPAITTLDATQDGVRPWVDLEWTRSAGVADAWIIERDLGDGAGFQILEQIPGTDGGSPVWTYRDWTAPGHRTLLYRVRPFVAGAAGAAGPSASVVLDVTGAWVVDPSTGRNFRFGGTELQLGFAEQSAWYEPIGAPAAVKRTFSLRGLEGAIAGTLKPYDGRSVESFDADLFAIKSRPSSTFRVAFGDVNIPATLDVVNSVWSTDARTGMPRKVVTVGLRQNGELPFPVVTP